MWSRCMDPPNNASLKTYAFDSVSLLRTPLPPAAATTQSMDARYCNSLL
jgi:hypothetical protein